MGRAAAPVCVRHAQAGDEGPFGDHTGYYTLPEPYPVFHVTAITHRKVAVYSATIVGLPPRVEGVFHNLVFADARSLNGVAAGR